MFRSTTSFNKEVYSAMANSLGAKEVGFWIRAAEETICFPNVIRLILEKMQVWCDDYLRLSYKLYSLIINSCH